MKILSNLLKSPVFLFGFGLFIFTIFIALFVPLFHNMETTQSVGESFMPPSGEYLFGTDNLGMDMMSLLIEGLRSSLYVGFLAGSIATVTGTLLGVYAGFKGGIIDDIINMITNIFLVIPSFVVLLLISSTLKEGRSLELIGVVIGLTAWTWGARAVRAQSSALKSRDHIALARVNGSSTFKIVTFHILPYLLSYVFMVFILQLANGIISESAISMIGLGPLDAISLGTILDSAIRNEALGDGAWWAFLPATILITLIAFSLYVVNTSMEGVFNPRLRK